MSSKGLNFSELAQSNPVAARRLAQTARAKLNAVTSAAFQHGTAVASGRATGIPNIIANMPGQGDLTAIPWPTVPYFGYDHHSAYAKLAFHIATWLKAAKTCGGELLEPADFTAIKAAAVLHALGRSVPWPGAENHAQRSAELAEAVMRKDPMFWGDDKTRVHACQLITGMNGEPPGAGATPHQVALWDADCFEQCRFAVNTGEGIRAMAAGFKRCISPWAKEPANQESWRKYRGWR